MDSLNKIVKLWCSWSGWFLPFSSFFPRCNLKRSEMRSTIFTNCPWVWKSLHALREGIFSGELFIILLPLHRCDYGYCSKDSVNFMNGRTLRVGCLRDATVQRILSYYSWWVCECNLISANFSNTSTSSDCIPFLLPASKNKLTLFQASGIQSRQQLRMGKNHLLYPEKAHMIIVIYI